MQPTLTDVILIRVELERERQRKLLEEGEIFFDVAAVREDDGAKLSVLVEEVGEVARAMNDAGDQAELRDYLASLKPLQEELVQVAAVAVAWAEAIQHMRNELYG